MKHFYGHQHFFHAEIFSPLKLIFLQWIYIVYNYYIILSDFEIG